MIARIRFLKKYFFDNKRQFVISFGILILLSIISVVPNLFLKRIFDFHDICLVKKRLNSDSYSSSCSSLPSSKTLPFSIKTTLLPF